MSHGFNNHSGEQAFRIAYLIAGYIQNTLTVQEHNELDAWVEASDNNMQLFEDLTNETNMEANLAFLQSINTEKALQETMAQLSFTPHQSKKHFSWWPYIVAASLVIAATTWYLFHQPNSSLPLTARQTPTQISPGTNKATLTLSNGTTLALHENSPSSITDNGTTISKKAEGELMYPQLNEVKEQTYNTLATPKGGQYSLTLSDGTRLWLNAQSSIRFPVQFTSSERIVELTGEAYFEVAKNPSAPFIIKLPNSEEIKVLGTSFNVMAYPGEEARRITLVEGRVLVKNKFDQLQLKPGQQAILKTGALTLNTQPNMDLALGWKNGDFIFYDMQIYEIMRQLERWYDVNVIFKTTTSEHFNASFPRNQPLSKILTLLQNTGKIHFITENNTIYVLP